MPKEGENNPLMALNAIRVLSLGWVITGHSLLILLFLMDNPLYPIYNSKHLLFQSVVNGTPSVDTFFVMGGMLVMLGTMKSLDKHHKQNGDVKFWVLFYSHRLIRLWPTILLTILFAVGIYPNLAALFYSPTYQNNIVDTSVSGACSGTKWLATAFFYNNIYNPETACIGS